MSAIIQKTEIEDAFLISPNSKFDILPHKGVTLLENTAVSTQYSKIHQSMNGANSVTLDYQVGERLFLDRGVFLEVDVPVELTFTTPLAAAPTKADYLSKAGYFKDIAFRQYGILSCLAQLNVQFNSGVVTDLTNIHKAFEMTTEYYNGLLIDKHFPASQPDRFVNYESYASQGADDVSTLDEDGDEISILVPAVAEENVFTGGYSNKYNSRRPAFKFVSGTNAKLQLLVKCHMYLPFSFFATADAETSLYGINKLTIHATFVDNFVKRLFVTKGTTFSDVSFDIGNQKQHKITMHMKTYAAPDYINNAMMDKNGLPKPYRIGYNKIVVQAPVVTSGVMSLSKGNSITSMQLQYGSLPKHIYISVHPVGSGIGAQLPNFKARINAIEAVIGNATTSIGKSALVMYNLCKGNGLEKDYEAAMFTNGFVVKLDVAKDLSVGGHLIGANIPTTMQFTVHFDCIDGEVIVGGRNYELRIAASFPSQLVYDNREFKPLTSLILSNAPYDIGNQAAALYAELSPKVMTIGAGVFGDIWSGIKKAGRQGINWVKNNPDKVAQLIGKGVRALAGVGGNVPYQQNMIGGQSSTLLLGAGNAAQNPFK